MMTKYWFSFYTTVFRDIVCSTVRVSYYFIKMSKVQSSVRKYVAGFGENIFWIRRGILFYKVCEIKVNCVKRFTVTQHLKTDKHIRAVNRKIENKSKSQQLLPKIIPEKSTFAIDLCITLLLANIYPFGKIEK